MSRILLKDKWSAYFYNGRLSVFLWVKHLAKRKPSFFWRFWREATIHPRGRDSSGMEFARFSAANRRKFGHVRFVVIGEFVGTHPANFHIFSSFWRRRTMVHIFGQHSCCQVFALFHGLVVDIWWPTSSFFIFEVCIVRFELLEPFFNLAFADWLKWLRCIQTVLEVVELNMANRIWFSMCIIKNKSQKKKKVFFFVS